MFKIATHPLYTISADSKNIHMNKTITLNEALLGYTFDVDYLDGKPTPLPTRIYTTVINPTMRLTG